MQKGGGIYGVDLKAVGEPAGLFFSIAVSIRKEECGYRGDVRREGGSGKTLVGGR